MTDQTVTQSNPNSQFSRRDFLAALPGFGLFTGASLVATRAALAALASAGLPSTPFSGGSTMEPPEARSAIIGQWEHKLDQVITSLESLWFFLHEARTQAPADVDGDEFSRLEQATFAELGKLSADMETGEFEALFETLTGKRAIFWCLKEQIQVGDGSAVDLAQEIEYLSQDEPALAAELLALLQAVA